MRRYSRLRFLTDAVALRTLRATAICATGFCLLLSCAYADTFRFAIIGDLPYGSADETNLADVLTDIGRSDSRFVIHLGDIKSGSEHCGDDLLRRRIDQLNSSPKPLLYTVGDNEWTDCHRRPAGRFDPVERLQWLRQQAFGQPRSLGQQTLPVQQQASPGNLTDGLPENLRWQQGGILFISFNIPGSNNNHWGQFAADHERNSEWAQRQPHNERWLNSSLAMAKDDGIRGVVLVFQGNPFERDSAEQHSHARDGFLEWRSALSVQLKSLGKPVLLVHGDTHTHRIDQALKDPQGKPVRNVTRLEAFGYPFTRNWVEVEVNTAKADLFTIRPRRLLQCDDCGNSMP